MSDKKLGLVNGTELVEELLENQNANHTCAVSSISNLPRS